MSFSDDWKTEQTSVPKNEIRFFRFFAQLLARHYRDVRYYEIHGHPGHVSFNSELWPAKPPITRELGDLIIITYNHSTGEARYTIQQNKFQRSSGAPRIRPSFKFKADIHQYDLLTFRPEIKSVGGINFPASILSGTDFDSVGSYGVFYEDDSHLIDFIYSTAKWLTPQSYVDSCNLILNTLQDGMIANERETVCSVGIEAFVKHLLSMRIGAPISSPQIGRFLAALIKRAADEIEEAPPVIDLPMLDQEISDNIAIGDGGYRLLVINTSDGIA